jgi:hypothetical protein
MNVFQIPVRYWDVVPIRSVNSVLVGPAMEYIRDWCGRRRLGFNKNRKLVRSSHNEAGRTIWELHLRI